MPHSLRAKLSGLRYKGILEDKDYKRLCHALDLEKAEQEPKTGKWIPVSERLPEEEIDVLDKIRAEIQENINYNKKMNYQGIVAGLLLTLDIIDKYKAEKESSDADSD